MPFNSQLAGVSCLPSRPPLFGGTTVRLGEVSALSCLSFLLENLERG